MSRNSHDGLCGICGTQMRVLSGARPICKDCLDFGVETIEMTKGLPREVNWQRVPDFVIEKELSTEYRTFFLCQRREPMDEGDMSAHIESCNRCGIYVFELAGGLESNQWWHSY